MEAIDAEDWRDTPDGPGAYWVRWLGGGLAAAVVYRGPGRLPGQADELWAGNARTVPVADPYYHGARWLRIAEPGYPPGAVSPCGAAVLAARVASRPPPPPPRVDGVFVVSVEDGLLWNRWFAPPARPDQEGDFP